ncbi:MAG: hypothetical protein WCA23_00720 [Stellaceae bacterium]
MLISAILFSWLTYLYFPVSYFYDRRNRTCSRQWLSRSVTCALANLFMARRHLLRCHGT